MKPLHHSLAFAVWILVTSPVHAQAAKGVPPDGAAPPAVTFKGLIAGVSTARDVLNTLGEPVHQAVDISD